MDEIAAGIELSVAKRCFVMAKKAGVVDSVTLTGGCAKNEGLKQAIEKVLKVKVVELPVDPQLMGALGAAEYARQKGRVSSDNIKNSSNNSHSSGYIIYTHIDHIFL